jgi:uncharacterized membrane protein
MSIVMATKTAQVRWLALISHLSLIVWVALWQLVISQHPHLNSTAVGIAWAAPLLLPLWGIAKGKPYTHAWANFILMLYFLHGLTIVYIDNGERQLAIVELLITSLSFVSNTLYARLRGRELGLKLTKLSVVEKEEKNHYGSTTE